MMGVMIDCHPDIFQFIEAKHVQGVLKNFNVSVLITDAFMSAVMEDADWELGFNVPPAVSEPLAVREKDDEPWYVYTVVAAKELWNAIIKSTYEYSEPGVIFIDRINDWNNLSYCEYIAATNPCGEQPLPPYGDCCLGHVNLARLVRDPFTKAAKFDWDTFKKVVRIGIRFLDNVLDVTPYPLPEQKKEALAKRRIGLGYTGLANCLAMLNMHYGDVFAREFASEVTHTMAIEAYVASAHLAEERGSFPLYSAEEILNRPFILNLPKAVQELIAEKGLRNGVIMSMAPVGTGSLYYNNVSSGLEPVFSYVGKRNVLQPDNTQKTYPVIDYGCQVWQRVSGQSKLPDFMVTANELTVEQHLLMHAAVQQWIDGSISKTLNCPKDMSYEDFEAVYQQAYHLDLKGCTTYRPSDVRGAILFDGNEPANNLPHRPEILYGPTYKVRWPSHADALYIHINELNGRPYEVFISSSSAKHMEWITGLTLMLSAVMRREESIAFVPDVLKKVVSASDSAWINGKFYGSLVAYIGEIIERHINEVPQDPQVAHAESIATEICGQCNNPTLIHAEGCSTCTQCGFSNCG